MRNTITRVFFVFLMLSAIATLAFGQDEKIPVQQGLLAPLSVVFDDENGKQVKYPSGTKELRLTSSNPDKVWVLGVNDQTFPEITGMGLSAIRVNAIGDLVRIESDSVPGKSKLGLRFVAEGNPYDQLRIVYNGEVLLLGYLSANSFTFESSNDSGIEIEGSYGQGGRRTVYFTRSAGENSRITPAFYITLPDEAGPLRLEYSRSKSRARIPPSGTSYLVVEDVTEPVVFEETGTAISLATKARAESKEVQQDEAKFITRLPQEWSGMLPWGFPRGPVVHWPGHNLEAAYDVNWNLQLVQQALEGDQGTPTGSLDFQFGREMLALNLAIRFGGGLSKFRSTPLSRYKASTSFTLTGKYNGRTLSVSPETTIGEFISLGKSVWSDRGSVAGRKDLQTILSVVQALNREYVKVPD